MGKASNIPQGGLRVVPCPVLASPWDRLDSPLELLGMDKPIKNPAQYKKKGEGRAKWDRKQSRGVMGMSGCREEGETQSSRVGA